MGISIYFKEGKDKVAENFAHTLTRRGCKVTYWDFNRSIDLHDLKKDLIMAAAQSTISCDDPLVPVSEFNNEIFNTKGEIKKGHGVSGHRTDSAIHMSFSLSDMSYVSIHIGINGSEITSISNKNKTEAKINPEIFIYLIEKEILKPSILEKMGVSHMDILAAQSQMALNIDNLKKLKQNNIDELDSINNYSSQADRTVVVLQRQAHILAADCTNKEGLYTFGAGPCAIVIGVAKNNSGQVTRVGMAHVDAVVGEASLRNYFSQMRGNEETLEISILGGEPVTAKRVLHAADQDGMSIIFSDANLDGSRTDNAAVDIQGKIFYGGRSDIERSVDSTALSLHNHKISFDMLTMDKKDKNQGTNLEFKSHY
jgi:hypothetical protein